MRPAGSLSSIAGEHPDPVPRSRSERLLLAAERLEDDLEAERCGNEAYEHRRGRGRGAAGRRRRATEARISRPRCRPGR